MLRAAFVLCVVLPCATAPATTDIVLIDSFDSDQSVLVDADHPCDSTSVYDVDVFRHLRQISAELESSAGTIVANSNDGELTIDSGPESTGFVQLIWNGLGFRQDGQQSSYANVPRDRFAIDVSSLNQAATMSIVVGDLELNTGFTQVHLPAPVTTHTRFEVLYTDFVIDAGEQLDFTYPRFIAIDIPVAPGLHFAVQEVSLVPESATLVLAIPLFATCIGRRRVFGPCRRITR